MEFIEGHYYKAIRTQTDNFAMEILSRVGSIRQCKSTLQGSALFSYTKEDMKNIHAISPTTSPLKWLEERWWWNEDIWQDVTHELAWKNFQQELDKEKNML